MKIRRYAMYVGTHRIRRDLRDSRGNIRGVKPCAEVLDGKRLIVMAAWRMHDDDPYPGEWAMTFERRYPSDDQGAVEASGLGWVASGDFESLEYVGGYGIGTVNEHSRLPPSGLR